MTDWNDDKAFAADLDAARAGDSAALDRLLTRLEHQFRADAERRVGTALRGRTRVSDVLQDAYVEVVRGIGKFQGSTIREFSAWVTTIIENSARQQHRHLTAKKRKPPSRTTELNALTIAYLRTVSSPLSDLQKVEDVELVYRALHEVREEHREVIEQLVFAQRPIEEVAAEIDRTEAATRMLLSRARAALTMKLEQLERERGKTD
ncbi:rpoE [Symbiodinium sp. KB8]|nr:rpoE [Symbiodinium sp. KB8]